MRCIMRNIAFLAVTVLYIVSTMGYGVHRCSVDGTASLILLCGEAPCEFAHSHTDSEEQACTHSHECSHSHSHNHCDSHNSDCCSTNVYVLTDDQNISDEGTAPAPDFHFIHSAEPASGVLIAYLYDMAKNVLCNWGFIIPEGELQASLCTFRI